MLRRTLIACFTLLTVAASRAEAITVRDIIELSKAGLGEPVLLALIEVDHSIFAIDPASLKQLKQAGVSDTVIVAMIRSGRPVPPPPVADPVAAPAPAPTEPQVVVIDHHDAAPAPAPYPVAVPVPVYIPVESGINTRSFRSNTVETTISTDQGLVKARLPVPPNCVKAEPVFWGFGGKLRPGSWEPPPTIVCR